VAGALPHAVIVAGHFHLVRLANQAVTDLRRRVTWGTHGRPGRSAAGATVDLIDATAATA
jgi:transposase